MCLIVYKHIRIYAHTDFVGPNHHLSTLQGVLIKIGRGVGTGKINTLVHNRVGVPAQPSPPLRGRALAQAGRLVQDGLQRLESALNAVDANCGPVRKVMDDSRYYPAGLMLVKYDYA